MWEALGVVVSALVAALAALLRLGSRSSRMRSRVQRDIELYSAIPDEFEAKPLLAKHIDSTIQLFVRAEEMNDARKTDWVGIWTAAVLATVGVALGYYLATNDIWIYLEILGWGFLVVLAVFALVGFGVSVRRDPAKAQKSKV